MLKELKLLGIVAGVALVIMASLFFLKYNQKPNNLGTAEIDLFKALKDGETVYIPNSKGLSCPEEDGYCFVSIIDGADPETFEIIGKGYAKDKDKVYYYGKEFSNDSKNFKTIDDYYGKDLNYVYGGGEIIKEANPEKFVVLTNLSHPGYGYAKDDKFLFYGNKKNPVDVDISTFAFLEDNSYAKDKKYIYYPNIYGFQILNEADPSSFKVHSNSAMRIATDNNYVFIWNKIINEADPATVLLLGGHYFKDRNSVFYSDEKIPGADPNTFEFIDDRYGKDEYNIYMDTRTMLNVDIQSFKAIDGNYFKDKNHVYGSSGEILENVDPVTITQISSLFKDKNHVYDYHFETILPYDATTFELIKNCDDTDRDYICWAKDKNGVYYSQNIVTDADPITFSVLGGLYGKDKSNVFYESKAINGADPLTFTYFDNGTAKDSSRVYNSGKVVQDIDPLSFTQVGKTPYSKDKKKVFWAYDLLVIEGSDSASFVPLGDLYFMGKDMNRVYAYGEPLTYVDASTFKILDNLYAKDDKNVYYVIGEEGED